MIEALVRVEVCRRPFPFANSKGHRSTADLLQSNRRLLTTCLASPVLVALNTVDMTADVAMSDEPASPSTSRISLYEGSTQYRHWRFSPEQLSDTRTTLNAGAVAAIRDAFEADSAGRLFTTPCSTQAQPSLPSLGRRSKFPFYRLMRRGCWLSYTLARYRSYVDIFDSPRKWKQLLSHT